VGSWKDNGVWLTDVVEDRSLDGSDLDVCIAGSCKSPNLPICVREWTVEVFDLVGDAFGTLVVNTDIKRIRIKLGGLWFPRGPVVGLVCFHRHGI
jgi:hypothetical protein